MQAVCNGPIKNARGAGQQPSHHISALKWGSLWMKEHMANNLICLAMKKIPLKIKRSIKQHSGCCPPPPPKLRDSYWRICVLNACGTCACWRQSRRFLALGVLDFGECDAVKQMARYRWYCHTGQPLSTRVWSAGQVERAAGFSFDERVEVFLGGGRWCVFVDVVRYVQHSVSSNEPVLCTKSHCFVYFCLSGMKKSVKLRLSTEMNCLKIHALKSKTVSRLVS